MKYPQSHPLAVLCFIYINKRDIGYIHVCRHDMHKRSKVATTFPITKWKLIKGEGKRGKERENSIRCESSCPAAITTPLNCALWPINYPLSSVNWRGVPCLMKLSELSLTLLIRQYQLQPPLTNCLDEPRLRLAATSAAVALQPYNDLRVAWFRFSLIPICTWPGSFIKHSTSISLPWARRDKVDINFTLR